jgi:predicted ATPase/class 3 adenylate cyclase
MATGTICNTALTAMKTNQQPGTYSFLFTDIEGSTRLWEQHPEAMQDALAKHDAILRAAIAANAGEVVKATGDGCHAAFDSALNGVRAALDAQLALEAAAWDVPKPGIRVRMGLHSGQAEQRAGDYFGPALNRAARIMSVGHGRQILLSAATVELVRDQLPAEVTLLDLGMHRLKDLIRPEHVFQLAYPALTSAFPPLRSLEAYPNNLPLQLTPFIGRAREINEAREMLRTARLLTLTGTGGTGKTRLALQLGADLLHTFADGVWLVELAPVSNSHLVVQAISDVFRLVEISGVSLEDQVIDYLHSKALLLVLDNCEHVVETTARLAGLFLQSSPGLKIIASSREALGIIGETVYHVPSLSVPDVGQVTVDALAGCEAVQLFIQIASMTRSHFALTERDAPAIAQICQRLDGIPLALELAAARIQVFSAEQIAARLDDRFRLLTAGNRTALPRQQTLRAMIDWSYDLLSGPEQMLLRRLSVFTGGWMFEAAEGVCPEMDILNLLTQLVNKSLVIVDEQTGQARYRLLETIRQYARDKLSELREETDARNRHLNYFVRLAQEAEPHLRTAEILVWQDRLEGEADNLRAAMEWGLDHDPEQALNMAGSLALFEGSRVFAGEGRLWVGEAIARTSALPEVFGEAAQIRERTKAKGWLTAGMLAFNFGEIPAAHAAFSESITLTRTAGDPFTLAINLGMRALTSQYMNEVVPARADAEESITMFLGSNTRWGAAMGTMVLAWAEDRPGDGPGRHALFNEARQLMERANHPMLHYFFMAGAMQTRSIGDFTSARSLLEESLQLTEHWRNKHTQLAVESELAHIARQSGDLAFAEQAYRKTIVRWKETGHRAAISNQLECLAFIARAQIQPGRAIRLLGAAEALRESIASPMTGVERVEYEREVAALREQVSPAAFSTDWIGGRSLTMDQAVTLALEPLKV